MNRYVNRTFNLTTTKFLTLMLFMYLGHLVPDYLFVQDGLASSVGGFEICVVGGYVCVWRVCVVKVCG